MQYRNFVSFMQCRNFGPFIQYRNFVAFMQYKSFVSFMQLKNFTPFMQCKNFVTFMQCRSFVCFTGSDGEVRFFITDSQPPESQDLFAINRDTGQITVARPLDYETIPAHQLTVTVRDSTVIPREDEPCLHRPPHGRYTAGLKFLKDAFGTFF